jgi:hypothetical protein
MNFSAAREPGWTDAELVQEKLAEVIWRKGHLVSGVACAASGKDRLRRDGGADDTQLEREGGVCGSQSALQGAPRTVKVRSDRLAIQRPSEGRSRVFSKRAQNRAPHILC